MKLRRQQRRNGYDNIWWLWDGVVVGWLRNERESKKCVINHSHILVISLANRTSGVSRTLSFSLICISVKERYIKVTTFHHKVLQCFYEDNLPTVQGRTMFKVVHRGHKLILHNNSSNMPKLIYRKPLKSSFYVTILFVAGIQIPNWITTSFFRSLFPLSTCCHW